MKNLESGLALHVTQDVTTIAKVFKLTLRNGETMGFTSFDQDIVFSEETNVIYKAGSGMTPTAISSSSKFNVDNLDVEGFLEDDRITESDLKYGKYDYASVVIGELNWADKPYSWTKVDKSRKGKIGEIKIEGGKFVAEIRGLAQNLQNKIGPLYQTTCRADLFDNKCKVNSLAFKSSGYVSDVVGNIAIYTFIDKEIGYFDGGKITFLTGLNSTLTYEVKSWDGVKIELQIPANYIINISDTFEVFRGCNKTIKGCQDDFGNAVNFRGEPYIPITSQILNNNL
jgi:uncharacterized phage protein (TIGR02218 family)